MLKVFRNLDVFFVIVSLLHEDFQKFLESKSNKVRKKYLGYLELIGGLDNF